MTKRTDPARARRADGVPGSARASQRGPGARPAVSTVRGDAPTRVPAVEPVGGAPAPLIAGADTLPFRGRTAIRLDPDLGIATVFGPSRTWCDEGPVERLLLVRPAIGRLQVTQGGRTLACCSRDALLVAASRGAVFAATAVERIDVLAIERSRLAAPLAALEPGSLRRIGRDHPGLQTLTAYAAGLLRGLLPVATAGLAELARAHLAELLTFIVREPDLQANGPVPRRRDQRIQALKAEVEQRLGSPDLSLDTVAQVQRISSRQIQALFQAEGETFSGFVLARRLDRAMQRLTDGDDARPVGAIAFDVGFGDLSYFNRTFRRRFGVTPSQARRLLRRADRAGLPEGHQRGGRGDARLD